jgi:hypothetical protein
VGASDENEICSLNARIDCRYIRRRNVTPPISPASVASHGMTPWRRRSVDLRQMWIDQKEVVPSVISQPAALRYFRMTGLLFPAFGWF